jgi:F-type H+-transporting ATPase subunit delta
MKDEIIVRRYADAFLEYARLYTSVENLVADAKSLRYEVLYPHAEFMEILKAPDIPLGEKNAFIDNVLTGRFLAQTIQLLKLLLEKKRIDKLSDILEFIIRKYAHEGMTEVVLNSAYPLDDSLIQSIEQKLKQTLGNQLKFYIQLDGGLLGGIQIIVGNKVIDGSVKKRLEDLREKLHLARIQNGA